MPSCTGTAEGSSGISKVTDSTPALPSRRGAGMIRAVRRLLFPAPLLLLLFRCASAPAPVPVEPPSTPAPPPKAVAQAEVVYVNASALNMRSGPSADAEIVAQLKSGTELQVVSRNADWVNVRLSDGRTGWVAGRFVGETRVSARQAAPSTKTGGKRGCESDYAFVQTPVLRGSDFDAHGLVVVEATVNVQGVVTSTKVISNSTGVASAAAAAEQEIRSAKFAPPLRNCQPRSFIFTYRRTF